VNIKFPQSWKEEEVGAYLKSFCLSNYKFKVTGDVEADAKEKSKNFQKIEQVNVVSPHINSQIVA
jgi:cAMP phosphodiesterase